MRYTLTLREEDLETARRLTFEKPGLEGACFLLCGQSQTDTELRFLCREVIPVKEADYLVREPLFLSLDSPCYVAAAKLAKTKDMSLLFVHSHPGGYLDFSEQDDREDPKLHKFFSGRVPHYRHGSVVLTQDGVIGRVWEGSSFAPMDLVRVMGSRFSFHSNCTVKAQTADYFDRQVRAFGPQLQATLSQLTIGVVGAGGTGSPTIEQLTRLGVGRLLVFDKDTLDETNVSRVYGSGVSDAGFFKVDIASRNIERVGLGTIVEVYPENITEKETALKLRECDLVFGCTDTESSRAVLTQLALRYLIPVFDMGVIINSAEGRVRNVTGRVTTLLAGEACLFCRGRITPERILQETRTPEERAIRVAEGYAPELAINNPAVVTFTTAVAASAVSEFLHRLSGFMGQERRSTEVLHLFDKCQLKTSRLEPRPSCFCSDPELWGSGDCERPFGMFS